MSQIGVPTGLNTIPAPVAPVPPQITAIASGSQYLRFKRRHQTIFLHCEPQELLSAVKLRLAAILGIDELDLRFYESMSPERKRHVLQVLEEKLKESAKLRKKKPGEPKPNLEEEIKMLEIPPLPDDKKLWELGLENDSIVHFVYRLHMMTDWDEWENPDPNGKTLGTSAGQIPSGDGFDPPGTAAARAAAAAAEEALQAERQAQQAREEEARFMQDAGAPPAEQ